jgi:diguanylate cyclase (GGDEF)-like protein
MSQPPSAVPNNYAEDRRAGTSYLDRAAQMVDWPLSRRVATSISLSTVSVVVGDLILWWFSGTRSAGLIDVGLVARYCGSWAVASALLAAVCHRVARTGADAPWTAVLVIAVFGAFGAGFIYLFGTMSTPFLFLLPNFTVLWSLNYGSRFGMAGFVYVSVLLVALGFLERSGVLPFAPAVHARDIDALGRDPWWFFGSMLFVFQATLFGFSQLFVALWVRKHLEARLREVNRALKHASLHDALTGLVNRRHLLEHMGAEAARRAREPRPFSLALFDVDHFKKVNDTYGHEAGDRVLKAVAGLLSGENGRLRAADLGGRWGGEEFLILMPETGLGEAMVLAERLRAGIAGHAMDDNGAAFRVTASFGVAEGLAGESFDDAIRRADAALYRAKHNGRNRVESA